MINEDPLLIGRIFLLADCFLQNMYRNKKGPLFSSPLLITYTCLVDLIFYEFTKVFSSIGIAFSDPFA